MAIKIEPVKTTELDDLVNISRKTFYDTFHQQNTKEDMEHFIQSSFNEHALKSEMSLSSNYFFFARLGDEIAGYLKISTAESADIGEKDVLEISRIYVVKEKLGSGVGKAMLQFAILFAQQQYKRTVFLGVWERNERAISFYKSFGFKKFGQHVFMVGRDRQIDWLMKREVFLEEE